MRLRCFAAPEPRRPLVLQAVPHCDVGGKMRIELRSLQLPASKPCEHCDATVKVSWYERDDGKTIRLCRVCRLRAAVK